MQYKGYPSLVKMVKSWKEDIMFMLILSRELIESAHTQESFLWPKATTMSCSSFYWGLPNKISLQGPVLLGGLCENKKRDQHIRVLNCLIDCLWSVLLQIYWDNLLFGQLLYLSIDVRCIYPILWIKLMIARSCLAL